MSPARVNAGDSAIEWLGREVLNANETHRAEMVESAFTFWRARGFPFTQLTEQERTREFELLRDVSSRQVIKGTHVVPTTLGLRLANSFHPQMWRVPAQRHRKSPLDYFEDDEVLRSVLERAPRFWPNRTCWNPQCVRSMFRVYGGGRVANFRPTAAKGLIERYSAAGDVVLDFSAGFGGRLLGCLPLNRYYFGIEPAAAQLQGLHEMVRSLGMHAAAKVQIVGACAEDLLPLLPARSVALVFSSPPYFNVERYSTETTQSYHRYSHYREWSAHFLRPVVEGAHRVLLKGGHLVMNVADVGRYPVATDVLRLAKPLFHARRTLRLVMHTRPLQRAVGSAAYRWEPVLVFQKR